MVFKVSDLEVMAYEIYGRDLLGFSRTKLLAQDISSTPTLQIYNHSIWNFKDGWYAVYDVRISHSHRDTTHSENPHDLSTLGISISYQARSPRDSKNIS